MTASEYNAFLFQMASSTSAFCNAWNTYRETCSTEHFDEMAACRARMLGLSYFFDQCAALGIEAMEVPDYGS